MTTKWFRNCALFALLVGVEPAPGASDSARANLTGSWKGHISDSTGSGSIAWRIKQQDDSIAGTMRIDGTSGVWNGSVSGKLTGTSLDFTLTTPRGAHPAYPNCSAILNGRATVTSDEIVGTYSATNSCFGKATEGRLSLTREGDYAGRSNLRLHPTAAWAAGLSMSRRLAAAGEPPGRWT